MKIEQDETIYIGLVRRIDKSLLRNILPDGRIPEFDQVLSEMTDKMKQMPQFGNLEPVGDSVHCFMVDDVEDLSYSYVIFRKGFTPKG